MKKTLVAVSIAILCSGCAGMQPKMDIRDLSSFKLDCSNKEAQIKFLRTQIPSSDEKMLAALGTNVFGEAGAAMRGEKSQNQLIKDGTYEATAKAKIWKLESDCANKTVYDYEDEHPRDWHGKDLAVHDLNGNR